MQKRKEKYSEAEESTSKTFSSLENVQKTTEALKKILKTDVPYVGTTPYYLHSGHYGLDYIMSGRIDGSGGYPGGQVVEIFGPKSTGKTLLMLYAVKNMQAMGGIAITADVERRWKKDFAEHHGVNWDALVIWSPETVEDFTVELINALESIEDNHKVLICLDSLASLSTYWEQDSKGIKEDQGKKAKRIKAAMRVLPALLHRKGAILLVANHIIEKPGVMYGPSYTTSGGQGIAFQATVRIELFATKQKKIDGKEVPVGVTMSAYCDKNSETIPFRRTSIDMLWMKGIDPYSGLIEMAKDHDIIKVSGGWYVWNGAKFHGDEAMKDEIRSNPEFLKDSRWKSPYYLSVGDGDDNVVDI